MRTSTRVAIVLVHENITDYIIDYRYNLKDLLDILDRLQEVNNFNPIKVKEFIQKTDKFYKKNISDQILNRIWFSFGRESSTVLYIYLDIGEPLQKKMLNSIRQLKNNLNYDEYNEQDEPFGDLKIRIWWD